jgi:predicted phosphodiesterase
MYDFKVPPATGTWTFAVISDPQISQTTIDNTNRYDKSANNATAWLATMEKVVAKNVSFIVGCGDQVDSTSTTTANNEYPLFFAPSGLRSLPFAPVIGNHDTANSSNSIAHFRYFFNRPNDQSGSSTNQNEYGNYYYRYNNILFVALNSSAYPTSVSTATPYITRFSNTIDAAKTAHAGKYDWLIVQHHKSTASVADHCGDADIQYFVEAGFEKLMSDKNVDFVLAGHDHVYARSWPLQGLDGGKVSLPNKTAPGPNNTFTNPGNPIYLTFSTSSTIKYYYVSADKTYPYSSATFDGAGYGGGNTKYPYLGAGTDGTVNLAGGTAYKQGNLPVSNATFVQARIPSYAIVEVSNDLGGQKSITFKAYPIVTRSGQDSGATQPYNFNENTPFDTVTVTK